MSIIYSNKDLIDPNTGEVIGKVRPLIYISGPMFSQGHIVPNITAAVDIAHCVYRRGWAPVVPHLSILAELMLGTADEEMWMDVHLSVVAGCKALVTTTPEWDAYTKEGKKTGTMREVELAESLGLDIYNSWREVPWLS